MKRQTDQDQEKRRAKEWEFRLYVTGQTPKSLAAFSNLKSMCEECLEGRYRIEVIDLMENPKPAKTDQVLATPTLVRKLPEPIKKITGDSPTRNVFSWALIFPCPAQGEVMGKANREAEHEKVAKEAKSAKYLLRLYAAGEAPKSALAIA